MGAGGGGWGREGEVVAEDAGALMGSGWVVLWVLKHDNEQLRKISKHTEWS